jgi:hypothetical protein
LFIRSFIFVLPMLALQACAPSVVGRHLAPPSVAMADSARGAIHSDDPSADVRVVYHYFASSMGPHTGACSGQETSPKDTAHFGAVICQGGQPIAFAAYSKAVSSLTAPFPGIDERRRLAKVAADELVPVAPVIALQ